ncbi:uncharacterized protein LOC117182967 [Belonocnema kinseyi]|uniref:uncharacterized protein LOC117182967 n=1 Tax=Belonocnema kinseyi TaxID=2817044 RepID=UPI00143CEE2D|nr:uncharacterized protein LOC117182967 [Belonocnema kinseyi]
MIYIVHSVLGMKKLCARWVPRLLTVDRKRILAQAKLHEIGFELVPQPPYSPDLAPSDYYLFPNLKRWVTGKRFYSNEELIAETEAYFGDLPIEYFSDGIKKLENRWTRCIDLKGEYKRGRVRKEEALHMGGQMYSARPGSFIECQGYFLFSSTNNNNNPTSIILIG